VCACCFVLFCFFILVPKKKIPKFNFQKIPQRTKAPSPTAAAKPTPMGLRGTTAAPVGAETPPVAVARKPVAVIFAVVGAAVAEADPGEPWVPVPPLMENMGE
jgi:hypothetical protein